MADETNILKGESLPFDSSALEAKIADSLAAIEDEPGDELVDESTEAVDEPADEVVEEASDDAADDESAEEPDDSAEEDDEEAAEGDEPAKPKAAEPAKKSSPTLPAAYRRTLQAYEWTDEEIDRAFAADPTNFTVTASKMHQSRSKEIAAWAQMGRAARDENAAPEKSDTDGKPATRPTQIPKIDEAALAEKYGDADLIADVVGPVNAAIDTINSFLPDLTSGVASVQQTRAETLAKQIDQFFGGDELKPYADLYGKTFEDGTPDQRKKRASVLETADALVTGAQLQGRRLSTNEALALAHDAVSAGHKVAAVRAEVRGAVKKRAQSVTIKPSKRGSKSSDHDGPANSRETLEERTAARLSKINW